MNLVAVAVFVALLADVLLPCITGFALPTCLYALQVVFFVLPRVLQPILQLLGTLHALVSSGNLLRCLLALFLHAGSRTHVLIVSPALLEVNTSVHRFITCTHGPCFTRISDDVEVVICDNPMEEEYFKCLEGNPVCTVFSHVHEVL